MITFSCTVFLALWELVKRLGGIRAARFALLLGISTPFFFADLWFTWPKLLAATFVLLAAVLLIERKYFRSGLMVGIGFLAHPERPRRPLRARPDLALADPRCRVEATANPPGHPAPRRDGRRCPPLARGQRTASAPGSVLRIPDPGLPRLPPLPDRVAQVPGTHLANTLVPLYLPIATVTTSRSTRSGASHRGWSTSSSSTGSRSPLHLGSSSSRCWCSVSGERCGVGPGRSSPPSSSRSSAFSVYWGGSSSGLLREGMQAWVLAVIAVIALQQATAGFPWFRLDSGADRAHPARSRGPGARRRCHLRYPRVRPCSAAHIRLTDACALGSSGAGLARHRLARVVGHGGAADRIARWQRADG